MSVTPAPAAASPHVALAQALGGAPFCATRLGRLAAYSATIAASTAHYWHRWLEANVRPHAPTASRTVRRLAVH